MSGEEEYYEQRNNEGNEENEGHKAKLSHEIAAGGVSYLAMKAYNDRQEENGQPVEHARAKEFLAAAGGALIDGLFESKGLDLVDQIKEKYEHRNDNREEEN